MVKDLGRRFLKRFAVAQGGVRGVNIGTAITVFGLGFRFPDSELRLGE